MLYDCGDIAFGHYPSSAEVFNKNFSMGGAGGGASTEATYKVYLILKIVLQNLCHKYNDMFRDSLT